MLALTILFLLTLKHAVCDLYLQSFLTINKRAYWGGWQHYVHHAIGTLAVLVWFCDPVIAIGLAVADGIAHWHVDWAKHRLLSWYETANGIGMESASRNNYWLVQALDQMLHFATYFILCLIVLGHS